MLKTLDTTALRSIFEPERVTNDQMISEGRTIRSKVDRRRFVTVRNASRAAQQIGKLPTTGEVVHLLLRANSFSCFDVLPAMIELAGRPADDVVLATLGVNERAAEELDRLGTSGTIKNCRMILSHYFRSVDPQPFAVTSQVFQRHHWQLGVCRSHAKLIMARFGRDHYVAAGSGNLRSCRSVENMDISNDRRLYKFYADFVDEMLAGGDAR